MPTDIFIIGDFCKDLDDEHALCLAAALHRQGAIRLVGVVGNLAPADLRARAAKGTLKRLGLPEIPVAVGLPVFEGQFHPYEADIPYLAGPAEVLPDGAALAASVLEKSADRSVVLALQSGFADALALFRKKRELFLRKVSSVAAMGGVEAADGEVRLEGGLMVPNNANNNAFDMRSAQELYAELQSAGVPLVITMRDAAYAAQMPLEAYGRMESTGNPVGASLKRRQLVALQNLWEAACSPAGSALRATLPDDRDRAWFAAMYCGGQDPGIADGADIRPFCRRVSLCDSVNLTAAVPELRRRFFDPIRVAVRGAEHLVIGLDRERHGVRDPEALREFLIETEIAGLSAGAS